MKTRDKRRRRGLHLISLAALFTVGNTLLRFPWANAEAGVIGSFLLSGTMAICTVLIGYPLVRSLFRKPMDHCVWRMIAAILLSVGIGAVAWFCAARSTEDALRFLEETLLPEKTSVPFSVLFLLAAVWLSRIPRRGVDLFAVIAYLAACAAVVVLFLRGVPQFRTEYGVFDLPSFSAVGKSFVRILPGTVLPMLPLAAYLALSAPVSHGRDVARPLVSGVFAGFGLMLLCVLQTLLTFGADYVATLAYPYSRAASVVSVGQYAFRPELLSYVPDYAATLVRTSVCFACMRRLVGRFLPRFGRTVPILAAIGVFLFLYLR